jgi:hypothetical protein
MVGVVGVELRAAQGRRATRLRYAPTIKCIFILKHSVSNRYQLQRLLFTTVTSTQTASDARLWS